MKPTFDTLGNLTFKEAHALFVKGFEGYFIPMNMSLDAYVAKLGNEGISPALSVVMYDGEVPIGFVLQAVREERGQKIAWNGGTGIIPDYRGKKLGTVMMEQALKVLAEQEVTVATLEALSMNTPAIELYKKVGYSVVDTLYFLESEGVLPSNEELANEFSIKRLPAFQAIASDIFPTMAPWQVDPAVTPKVGGEAIIAERDGEILAACLIRKRHTFGKEIEGVTLFQTNIKADTEEGERALQAVLQEGLLFDQPIKRTTFNLLDTEQKAIPFLLSAGFKHSNISQVFMVRS